MKKLFYLLLLPFLLLMSCKDEVVDPPNNQGNFKYKQEQKSTGFFLTANWCIPCGDYGVPAVNAAASTHGDKFVWFSCHRDGPEKDHFSNIDAEAMAVTYNNSNMPVLLMGANAESITTIEGATDMETTIKSAISSHLKKTPVANIGLSYTISDGAISVITETEFYEDSPDAFYIGVYLLEDKLVNRQKNSSGWQNNFTFNNVLRLKLSSSITGDQLPATAKTKGMIDRMVFGDFLLSNWKEANLKVAAVLFKKDGSGNFVIVNGTVK